LEFPGGLDVPILPKYSHDLATLFTDPEKIEDLQRDGHFIVYDGRVHTRSGYCPLKDLFSTRSIEGKLRVNDPERANSDEGRATLEAAREQSKTLREPKTKYSPKQLCQLCCLPKYADRERIVYDGQVHIQGYCPVQDSFTPRSKEGQIRAKFPSRATSRDGLEALTKVRQKSRVSPHKSAPPAKRRRTSQHGKVGSSN
jgi:hypothetical protein